MSRIDTRFRVLHPKRKVVTGIKNKNFQHWVGVRFNATFVLLYTINSSIKLMLYRNRSYVSFSCKLESPGRIFQG
jgi:hypothetical protein